MRIWFYIGAWVVALGLQVTIAPSLSLWGQKPNLALIILLLLGFRWMDPWLFILGAAMGLAVDVFSHGILGVYGISFFAAAWMARSTGQAIYENNIFISMAVIVGLSLAHGVVAVTLFETITPEIPWWSWMFFKELPLAFYNGLLVPFLFWPLVKLEKRFNLAENTGGLV